MKRYLLFDSACSVCRELADTIEHEVDGWLTARSLREPEVQALLNQTQSEWSWEPTLLEVEGEQVRAFTGFSLRLRLLLGLGPGRAWRVARLVSQAGVSPVNMADGGLKSLTSRRGFLRGIVQSATALMAAKVLTAFPEEKQVFAQISENKSAQDSATVISGDELKPLVEEALKRDNVQLVQKYLREKGYNVSIKHSRGFKYANGNQVLMLIFVSSDGRKDFGQIVWSQSPDGSEQMLPFIVRYSDRIPKNPEDIESVDEILKYMHISGLVVINGRVEEKNSPHSTSRQNVTDNCDDPGHCYAVCWVDRILTCCGPAAASCAFAGPAWVECILFVCGICVNIATITCAYLCTQEC